MCVCVCVCVCVCCSLSRASTVCVCVCVCVYVLLIVESFNQVCVCVRARARVLLIVDFAQIPWHNDTVPLKAKKDDYFEALLELTSSAERLDAAKKLVFIALVISLLRMLQVRCRVNLSMKSRRKSSNFTQLLCRRHRSIRASPC